MANMTLIEAKTSTSTSVTFSSIPQNYTDLMLKVSVRTTATSTASLLIKPNGSASNQTAKRIYGTGSTILSDTGTNALINGTDTTTNTFANTEIYFSNYTSAVYKSFSLDGVMENNATFGYNHIIRYLWADNTAISSLLIETDAGNFATGSTFYLYGISNVTSGTKATGGVVSSDGTYWYHMFPFSGTFTPTTNLTADYLVIAGGGGGGKDWAGGGGAGGLRSTVGATGGGGSLESAVSLTANTAYSVTVGGGGAGATASGTGTAGSNSIFSGSGITTITSTSGGGGASPFTNGATGGSGGGGGYGATSGGAGTTNQGYVGGNSSGNEAAGGGGGSGAAGSAGVSSTKTSGAGGIGVQITAIANATQTGVNGYYAGGGGGGAGSAGVRGIGNSGGGNGGFPDSTVGFAGITNTGSGGGGGGGNSANGGAGGSGLVIIRYAI